MGNLDFSWYTVYDKCSLNQMHSYIMFSSFHFNTNASTIIITNFNLCIMETYCTLYAQWVKYSIKQYFSVTVFIQWWHCCLISFKWDFRFLTNYCTQILFTITYFRYPINYCTWTPLYPIPSAQKIMNHLLSWHNIIFLLREWITYTLSQKGLFTASVIKKKLGAVISCVTLQYCCLNSHNLHNGTTDITANINKHKSICFTC